MSNLQRRLAGARAASRVLRAGHVDRPPVRAVFRRYPWFRRGVIATTVVAFLFVQQVPVRTFLVWTRPVGRSSCRCRLSCRR